MKNPGTKTHGMRYTNIYDVWRGMKKRTTLKSNSEFERYGARGIKVCARWFNSFENFYVDMFSTYKKGLSIDRINNNGHYSKRNCRWSTNTEQQRNKANNVKYKGETATEASLRLGLSPTTVHKRIENSWSKKKAFTTPKTK